MAKQIDFIMLSETNPEYTYSLEAYDDLNRSCGGCRTKSKEDLKAMNNLWKELYGLLNLRYIYKKNDTVINLN